MLGTLDTLYTRNTNPNLYTEDEWGTNCGSFALGVDRWYCPYLENTNVEDELFQYTEAERADWMFDMVYHGYDAEEIAAEVVDRDFEFILKTCPWLEPIDEEDICADDRVIAYRMSIEIPDEVEEFDVAEYTDFHFRVLINGEWWEKNGAGPVHKVEDPDCPVWFVDDYIVYAGKIRYARFITR